MMEELVFLERFFVYVFRGFRICLNGFFMMPFSVVFQKSVSKTGGNSFP